MHPHYYWISNYYACAIVAVVTRWKDVPFDWAAYIGGAPSTESEEETVDRVSRLGSKIGEDLARFLFPQLDQVPYRA